MRIRFVLPHPEDHLTPGTPVTVHADAPLLHEGRRIGTILEAEVDLTGAVVATAEIDDPDVLDGFPLPFEGISLEEVSLDG